MTGFVVYTNVFSWYFATNGQNNSEASPLNIWTKKHQCRWQASIFFFTRVMVSGGMAWIKYSVCILLCCPMCKLNFPKDRNKQNTNKNSKIKKIRERGDHKDQLAVGLSSPVWQSLSWSRWGQRNWWRCTEPAANQATTKDIMYLKTSVTEAASGTTKIT